MKWNKKAQYIFPTMMIAIVVIVLTLAFIPALNEFTFDARNQTNSFGGSGLDCDNSTISDFDKGTCLITDLQMPYFVIAMIAIAGIIIGAKITIGE